MSTFCESCGQQTSDNPYGNDLCDTCIDNQHDPWVFERPLGSEPDRPVDARLAALVPLPPGSVEWLRTVRRIAEEHDLDIAVKVANIRYPLK